MPDLFPTTKEAESEAQKELPIVNHLGPDSFKPDGLRPFFEYRKLGIEELTNGKVGAHVIRAKPGQHADAPRHTHTLDFQFVYVLKGWAVFEYEGYGEHKLVEGSTVYQPPGIKHKEIAHSDDFEVLEITMPGHERDETVIRGQRYAATGVPEYWIVDPTAQTMTFLRLADSIYQEQPLAPDGRYRPAVPLCVRLAIGEVVSAGVRGTHYASVGMA